ncbi:hypothetical protein EXIGLDRAFT_767448 [Exidia glandulosa HHB12029]|uniref:C3H1-type domain-containing protein n=1 Tax=Exidia glandulosa HHB12029 TaxID=1314781 RepID=A0A165J0S6_EXIGL|nr:hypothetical protein EXIGLDRAFT_711736 [Exidia glandulosa HHB12029]KZV94157.1 hypothetical protein EXIGLDRAFT_767448 [Exidia glandulosa HHB12029]
MVSALWKACATGDAGQVAELLRDATPVDIEVKDHTGVTPLIQAIRNGHVDVVKILLDHGADPANASSSGRPENYTSDPAILELLGAAVAKNAQAAPAQPNGPAALSQSMAPYPAQYGPEGYASYDPSHDGAPKGYYGAPVPMPYAQYYAQQPPPDGSAQQPNGPPPVAFYPMPPPGAVPPQGPQPEQSADGAQPNGGNNNLPPPHVARAIPCRYYPACRYGASCMFLHPQTPYFQGPLPPPAQYPPPPQMDPMSPQSAYPQAYYPVPPGAYPPPPPGAVMGSPVPNSHPASPRSYMHGHSRAASEMMSPLAVPPSALPPVQMVHYGMPAPMSPYGVQQGLPPMGMVPGPPPHMSPQVMASPQMYPSSAPMGHAPLPHMSPYHTRRDSISSYHPEFASPVMSAGDPNLVPKSPLQLQASMDGYPVGPHHSRDGSGHRGRGGRASIGGGGRGKPPCLFFPSGRCRNGDQCRFPHVMPDGPVSGPPSRIHKSRMSMGSIESKLANLGLRDDASAPNGHKVNGFGENGRGGFVNGRGGGRRSPLSRPQRVPVAEDFPVLGGTRTPPIGPNGHVNGTVTPNGPTAAQVLRAPAPVQKDQLRSPAPAETPKVDGEAAPTTATQSLDAVAPEVPVSA